MLLATLLIVANNDFLRRTLGWWLKMKFPEYEVVEAAGEENIIDLLQSYSPRVVILDTTLPKSNPEIISRIRATSPAVKIVGLTFREDEIGYANAASNGVNVYISHEKIQSTLQPALAKLLADHRDGFNEHT